MTLECGKCKERWTGADAVDLLRTVNEGSASPLDAVDELVGAQRKLAARMAAEISEDRTDEKRRRAERDLAQARKNDAEHTPERLNAIMGGKTC